MIKLYIFLCWVEWVLCMFWMLTSSQKYYLQISSPIQWVFFLFCQHNLYQNANGIFHKTRRSNSKISMETQKSPNSQSSFKKEKLIKLYHTPWFQTKLQSYGYQNSMLIYCCSVSRPCPTLRPHTLQCARIPCPSPSPRTCSNSCPSRRWCHPTISSSVIPFSSCLQSFPASGSFPMSQVFASGGQSTGASASASVLPANIQAWFPCSYESNFKSWFNVHIILKSAFFPQHSIMNILLFQ